MKKLLYLALIVCATSCTKDDASVSTQQTRTITFSVGSPDITITPMTRASLTDASCTDLWIFEGSTLLAHKQSTDADFASPSVTLTYGIHSLTFIASESKEQSFSSGVWSTSKVIEDFAKTMSVTIDGTSQSSLNVELARRSSRVQFTTTDNVPATVSKCHLTVANHKSLDAELKAGTAYSHEATLDIRSYQGKTYTVFVNTLTESATDEEDCDVMIEFLDASSAALYHYERTVKIKPNRITNITGAYFTGGSNLITVNTTWDTQNDVNLFGE